MIAIYARQSVEKKDSISIESQIDFAKRELTTEEFTVFSDSGYSGKHTNRPAFSNLMTEITNGTITKVIVYRLDRISRSLVDFADFIDILEQHKVSFVSATEKFDTETPMGRAMLYIVIVFAQLERETIAERVKDNYYSRVRQGAWGGGPAPFGFHLIRKEVNQKMMTQLEPTENIAVVQRIFDLYHKPHMTLSDIQKILTEETTLKKMWNASKLSTILKNPVYVKADATIYEYYKNKGLALANDMDEFQGDFACYLTGKYSGTATQLVSLSPHKGVIDSHIFLSCQEKLKNNQQIKNQYRGTHSYLSGLLQCGYCGYSFSVKKSQTKEGTTAYFSCSGRYLHKCCHEKQTHRVAEVEALVAEKITDHIKEIAFSIAPKTAHDDALETQERQLDSKLNCLLESLSEAPKSTQAYILKRIATLHEEKEEIAMKKGRRDAAKRADSAVADSAVADSAVADSIFYCNDFDWSKLSFAEKKEVARLLLKKVILKKNEIHIVLKTATNRK